MELISKTTPLSKLVVIGDKVLIKPKSELDRANSSLYLPPNVRDQKSIQVGYVMKVGPGTPIPSIETGDEPWKEKGDSTRYLPLQPNEGDEAIFVQNGAHQIEYNREKYLIVSQAAILMLIRHDD